MKTFHPTESEFENPIDYIENIMEKYDGGKYGCVKIVPPSSFKPDVALDLESNVKYPTRYQILQELAQGKAFKENNTGHTFEKFREIAREREKQEPMTEKDYIELEKDYWSKVDYGQGEVTLVEYAADVPTLKYGSGFGRPGQ